MITAALAIPLLSASERTAFTGMLAKLERIEAIWLPRVGKAPWTIGEYVWELDSVMQHPGEVLHRRNLPHSMPAPYHGDGRPAA